MNTLQAAVLGIIQGLTEFIPVSSSAHLLLVPWLLGWEIPSLSFDIVLHLGTLGAVLAYFRAEWLAIIRSMIRWLSKRDNSDPDIRLAFYLAIATVPAAVLGGLLHDFFETLFASPPTAALMLIITAVVLMLGERLGKQSRNLSELNLLDAILVGIAQAIAIVPGISRSGTTISAGRLRGLRRDAAARFSFLMAMPITLGVGIVQLADLAKSSIDQSLVLSMVIGFVSSLASGYLVIHWLLGVLRTRSTVVFAIYCVGLA